MTIHLHDLSEQIRMTTTAIANDCPMPVEILTWQDETVTLPPGGTHFGFCFKGTAYLHRDRAPEPFPLTAGMYFSLAEAGTIQGESAAGMVVSVPTHEGQFLLGGPVDPLGRFAYIDGGTTSLLVAPMRIGDPCLNALYMPPNVDQTLHSHPSDRIGLIIGGSGQCCFDDTCYDLLPGHLFHISADQPHRFVTEHQQLDLVVFHPDSDMGFSDRNHPMLSRTFVNNIRATELPNIQTPT